MGDKGAGYMGRISTEMEKLRPSRSVTAARAIEKRGSRYSQKSPAQSMLSLGVLIN